MSGANSIRGKVQSDETMIHSCAPSTSYILSTHTCHGNARQRVDYVGEGPHVRGVLELEGALRGEEAAANEEDEIEGGEQQQQVVEDVPLLHARDSQDGDEVAHGAGCSQNRHGPAGAPVFEGGGQVVEVVLPASVAHFFHPLSLEEDLHDAGADRRHVGVDVDLAQQVCKREFSLMMAVNQ